VLTSSAFSVAVAAAGEKKKKATPKKAAGVKKAAPKKVKADKPKKAGEQLADPYARAALQAGHAAAIMMLCIALHGCCV
jgi:hypothetical protein